MANADAFTARSCILATPPWVSVGEGQSPPPALHGPRLYQRPRLLASRLLSPVTFGITSGKDPGSGVVRAFLQVRAGAGPGAVRPHVAAALLPGRLRAEGVSASRLQPGGSRCSLQPVFVSVSLQDPQQTRLAWKAFGCCF